LTEAFTGLEAAYTAAWRASTIDDVAAREKLFLAINIVGKVRDHLTRIVMDGKLAAAELKALAETAERRKRYGTAARLSGWAGHSGSIPRSGCVNAQTRHLRPPEYFVCVFIT
jgi:hypothetical protein